MSDVEMLKYIYKFIKENRKRAFFCNKWQEYCYNK